MALQQTRELRTVLRNMCYCSTAIQSCTPEHSMPWLLTLTSIQTSRSLAHVWLILMAPCSYRATRFPEHSNGFFITRFRVSSFVACLFFEITSGALGLTPRLNPSHGSWERPWSFVAKPSKPLAVSTSLSLCTARRLTSVTD